MIVVTYGSHIAQNTYDCLAASDVADYLKPDHRVAIKPNLVLASPAAGGATTHPEVIEGIILYLKDFGVKQIRIIEGSWVGDSTKRAFQVCGYEALSKKHNVPLVDLKRDRYSVLDYGGFSVKVCQEALEADFLINAPVLKAHCQTGLTCCMKNLKGCIPDSEKRRFHELGIHKPVAVLNRLIRTGYCVVDGVCGDLSFEEGGNPVTANRIIAGQNPLLVDSYCAELIGYKPEEIDYLVYGREFGAGVFYSAQTKLVELYTQNKPAHERKSDRTAERYRRLIREDAACSACYSSLIYALHRLGGVIPKGGGMRRDGQVCIGQGFREQRGEGFGIGNCTGGLSVHVPGCPPKATDIIEAWRSMD
ncbi:MAG: DUF362 domain-containing protein [Clostridiales bacterium]|nr:DUF362 domain-containing protein [Clostridiales bacterium]